VSSTLICELARLELTGRGHIFVLSALLSRLPTKMADDDETSDSSSSSSGSRYLSSTSDSSSSEEDDNEENERKEEEVATACGSKNESILNGKEEEEEGGGKACVVKEDVNVSAKSREKATSVLTRVVHTESNTKKTETGEDDQARPMAVVGAHAKGEAKGGKTETGEDERRRVSSADRHKSSRSGVHQARPMAVVEETGRTSGKQSKQQKRMARQNAFMQAQQGVFGGQQTGAHAKGEAKGGPGAGEDAGGDKVIEIDISDEKAEKGQPDVADSLIYFEKQKKLLCGQSALNNFVQGNVFTETQLVLLSKKLFAHEEKLHNSSGNPYSDGQGNFSLQVLELALENLDKEYELVRLLPIEQLEFDFLQLSALVSSIFSCCLLRFLHVLFSNVYMFFYISVS